MKFSNPSPRPLQMMGPIMPTQPSFTQSVKEGFSLGIGVNLANRVVNSVFGPPASSHVAQTTKDSCHQLSEQYNTCVMEKRSVEECTKILDTLNACYKK